MASRSGISHLRHDVERPTLPPIRDLFHDLRTPHDSPSLTLARLHVSDDYDEPSSYASTCPSFAPGAFRLPIVQPPRSQTSQLYQYNAHYRYHDPPPSLLNHSHERPESSASQHSSEPFSGYRAPPRDPLHASTRESLLHAHEARGFPAYAQPEWSLNRHTSDRDHSGPSSNHPYGTKSVHPTREDHTPIARYPPYAQSGRRPAEGHSRWPREISTTRPAIVGTEDERTPVARNSGLMSQAIPSPSWKAPEDTNNGSTLSKYECSYCGKGFNRPSSLKIHLNSHTGAKPFVCPVESCRRSFSVLSNMRRHARVHTQTSLQQADPSSDEESERSSSLTGSAQPPAAPGSSEITVPAHRRRSSIASVSSTGSRKSLAPEEETMNDNARPEKRSRRHPN